MRRWERPIYHFVYRFTGGKEDSEDICQEVFTIAFSKLKGLKEKSKFSPWIYKIALNQCRIQRRREKGRKQIPLRAAKEAERLSADPSVYKNPESLTSQKEMAHLLEKAFRAIPEEQRAVIIMKEYNGLKFDEIAEIVDCPVGTVKSRMYLGLKALKEELKKLGVT